MLKINFSYTDEFGQESNLIKTFTEDVLEITTSFDLLVDEFKNFLNASGFMDSDKITIVENEDEN